MTDDSTRSEAAKQAGVRPTAVYANHLTVDIDLAEVCLNFGQLFDAGQPPQITTRVITNPVHLKRFRQIIMDGCERYSADYEYNESATARSAEEKQG